MLNDAPIITTIPVSDVAAAREFYEKKVGLKPSADELPDGGARYECGSGTGLILYPTTQNAGKSPATLAGWRVDDIESVVADLKGRGVTFEEYDQPPIKTENGIATLGNLKAAWFKDQDGNILAVNQM